MKASIATLFFAAICFSSAAAAQNTTNTTAPVATQATPAPAMSTPVAGTADVQKDSVVCSAMYHEGSVIQTGRTCMTKREWAVQHHQLQQNFREFQMRADQFNR